MTKDGRRALRVAELVRARFAEVARQKLGDPALSTLVITDVGISDDLSIVDIRLRFLGVEDPSERKRLLRKLERVLPVLRRIILDRLGLRRAPELRVHYDEGADAAERVQAILREIEDERRARPEPPGDEEPRDPNPK